MSVTKLSKWFSCCLQDLLASGFRRPMLAGAMLEAMKPILERVLESFGELRVVLILPACLQNNC